MIVMDEKGQHVISLLSGHLGGANELATWLAGRIGGQAVITTANTMSIRSPVLICWRRR